MHTAATPIASITLMTLAAGAAIAAPRTDHAHSPSITIVPWLVQDDVALAHITQSQIGPELPFEMLSAAARDLPPGCTRCDTAATAALESPLPTSWTEYGDSFANRPDAIAGQWLRDNGCFLITACFGAQTPANALRYPAAFDYTQSLPAFKVCGTLSNFTAPNDVLGTTTLFNFEPQNPPNGPTFGPSPACTPLPVMSANQRDQDYIRIIVPPSGIANFRLFVTAAAAFDASIVCNKFWPAPGTINGCWTASTTPPAAEFGFSPYNTPGEDPAFTNNPQINPVLPSEGAKDSTWIWPRSGPRALLEPGEYLLTIRLKPFDQLDPPNLPTPPNTCYQIQIVGQFGDQGGCCLPGCSCFVTTEIECASLSGVFAGLGTTCVESICNAPCPSDLNDDGVTNTADLVLLLAGFGVSGAGDLTCDGMTDTQDLVILLSLFGGACE